jgi:hypothetical protein
MSNDITFIEYLATSNPAMLRKFRTVHDLELAVAANRRFGREGVPCGTPLFAQVRMDECHDADEARLNELINGFTHDEAFSYGAYRQEIREAWAAQDAADAE